MAGGNGLHDIDKLSIYQKQQTTYAKIQRIYYRGKKYCDVLVAIIGRDRNILETQQNSIRGGHTTPQALEQFSQFENIVPVHYISQ